MPPEPISPELALVDPELAARARQALPYPASAHRRPRPSPAASPAEPVPHAAHRPYPLWARVTGALWLLVLGILIGGAAIPHAQDKPRVIPAAEDPASLCEVPAEPESPPVLPQTPRGPVGTP